MTNNNNGLPELEQKLNLIKSKLNNQKIIRELIMMEKPCRMTDEQKNIKEEHYREQCAAAHFVTDECIAGRMPNLEQQEDERANDPQIIEENYIKYHISKMRTKPLPSISGIGDCLTLENRLSFIDKPQEITSNQFILIEPLVDIEVLKYLQKSGQLYFLDDCTSITDSDCTSVTGSFLQSDSTSQTRFNLDLSGVKEINFKNKL